MGLSMVDVGLYREIHDQTAQSALSCAHEVSSFRDLGNKLCSLVANIEGFAKIRHIA